MTENERLIRLIELVNQLDKIVSVNEFDKMNALINRIDNHLKKIDLTHSDMALKKDFQLKYELLVKKLINIKKQMKKDQNNIKNQMNQVMTGYFSKNAIKNSHYNHLG